MKTSNDIRLIIQEIAKAINMTPVMTYAKPNGMADVQFQGANGDILQAVFHLHSAPKLEPTQLLMSVGGPSAKEILLRDKENLPPARKDFSIHEWKEAKDAGMDYPHEIVHYWRLKDREINRQFDDEFAQYRDQLDLREDSIHHDDIDIPF